MFSFLARARPNRSLHWSRLLSLGLVVFVLGTGTAQAQDLVVNDGTQESFPSSNCNASPDNNTIQGAVDDASAGETILVCPGTYVETVNVTKSLTINGPYNGTPGYDGARGTDEAVVDAGASSPVDRTANIAFTVRNDDVTIDGFKLIGNQGIVLDPNGVSSSPPNDGTGLTVRNNLIGTDIVGVQVENVTTLSSKSFTIADNQFELRRQSFDLNDTQEQNLGGDADNTEGDEAFEYTASVALRTIDGDQAPTIQNNVVTDDGNDVSGDGDPDGSFYGYAIDGVKVNSGPTTVAGDPGDTGNTGAIQGTVQGISVLDGQSSAQSNVSLEDFDISAMSGSAPNNSRVNFQSGIFTFTATSANNGTTDIVIANTTIEGLDFSDPEGDAGANASANLYLSNFDNDFSGRTLTHNVTIKDVTIQNTEHRGISLAGTGLFDGSDGADDINATITDDGSGDGTVIKGVAAGNDAHAIHSENGGSPTIDNTTITNVNTPAAEAIHVRPSEEPGTVTIGTDVTINSAGQATVGDQGAGISSPPGNQIAVTDASTDLTVDGFRQDLNTGHITFNVKSGAELTLTGRNANTQLDQLNDSLINFESNAVPVLSTGTHEAPATASFPQLQTQNPGAGDPILTGSDTLRVTDRLTLSSGTFDVTGGHLALSSTSETSTTAISPNGNGSVNGDVIFERFLAKSDDASHFRMISAPTATLLDDEGGTDNADNLLSNMWTQSDGSSGTGADAESNSVELDPSVFTYDEGATLGGDALSTAWSGLTNLNSGPGNFSPGTGFLAYLFTDRDFDDTDEGFPITLSAAGPVQAEENNGSAVDLSSRITFTNDSDPDSDNGWNLIANPFMAPIDWESIENDGADLTNVDKTIYVYDAENGGYATYTADGSTGGTGTQDQYISPFQAFFVKANGDSPDIGGIDNSDKALSQNPEIKRSPSASPAITLRLRSKNSGWKETTAVQFSETASLRKDTYDAYQLQPLTRSYAMVASEMNGTNALFDHQHRPTPTARDTIDLALDITRSGTYILDAGALEHLPKNWTVVLENTDSGTRYDLRNGETATFDYNSSKTKSNEEPVDRLQALQDGPTVAQSSPTSKSKKNLPSFRLYVGPSGSTFPVELAQFEGRATNGTIELTWSTERQANSIDFYVERSPTGEDEWTSLGSKKGDGTSASSHRYTYTDNDLPYEGTKFSYRLKQVDADGAIHYSKPIEVKRGTPSTVRLQSIYPNPTRTQATVRYNLPETSPVTVAVYDVLGRKVSTILDETQDPGRKEITVPVESLSDGVHFLRLRAGQTTKTRKLVVVE